MEWVQWRVIVKVGPFCRKGLSPPGEPVRRGNAMAGRYWRFSCTQVAASREVLLGKEDLPNSATAVSWIDLLGLVGFDGDFAGEQVLHETGFLRPEFILSSLFRSDPFLYSLDAT